MEAKELYDICFSLAKERASKAGRRRMYEALSLCCSEGTRGHTGCFGNLFSHIDFICKQRGIGSADRIAIQTARLNSKEDIDGNEDDSQWLYDVRALTLFVSAVFKEDVPDELRRLLPSTAKDFNKDLKADRAYIRCIVRSWDDTTITAFSDDEMLTIDYAANDGGRDFSYLKKLLRDGMQLNLLDCEHRDESNILLPKLIIVEPDFLVDISSIATCFTPYGHHPLLYTLNRLKERPNTQATLLGNFAGAALDFIVSAEHVKESPDEQLRNTLRRSFKEQAIKFAANEDFNPTLFKTEAKKQMENIRQAVDGLFGNDRYDRMKALLEPSFICEKLGLQGRVDLMTKDMRLLVEQKSGKNIKIEHNSHDSHGLQKEDHYVQLILYYGILHYNFGRTEKTVDNRLLYSHYEANKGLLSVNFYRTLFREAIKLRNQIVATELFIAREGFGRIVPQLIPSIIYKGVAPDGYFNQYIIPELELLNNSIRKLSPLERAYYERMMTFVYNEQACQKLGTPQTLMMHSSGAASDLWQMPLTEKQETGNIILNLSLINRKRRSSFGGYDEIELSGELPATLNFRRGDMVYLYSYHNTPDVRKSILYKGTLEKIAPDKITVVLTNGQHSPEVFSLNSSETWAVEHGGSDTGASGSIRSLQQFTTANPQRRALLLGQREPRSDKSLHLSQNYSNSYDAILEKVKQSRDYFLLVGPPGTGKTSQALRFMVKEELKDGGTLLLTAYTNRAIDEICEMLDGENLDYLRLGNEASCDERFRNHLLESIITDDCRLEDIRKAIGNKRIIVSTTSMLLIRPYIMQLKRFSLCIVDEASQILEPGLIGLLSNENIGRFVLIGDHKQLPAVVQQDEQSSSVTEPCLREIVITDCRQSLFERLIRWENNNGRTDFIATLNRQGRMHPEIAQFPSSHFYSKDNIQAVPLKHQEEEALSYRLQTNDALDDTLASHRVIFINMPSSEKEAQLVALLLHKIKTYYGSSFDTASTAGVIVPYRQQIGLIRKALEAYNEPELLDVSIDTVERYQGSQRDVIVYSFAIEHAYQLDFLTANTITYGEQSIDRKLNVAMTRARRQLIMTGSAKILRKNNLFREIVEKYDYTEQISEFIK